LGKDRSNAVAELQIGLRPEAIASKYTPRKLRASFGEYLVGAFCINPAADKAGDIGCAKFVVRFIAASAAGNRAESVTLRRISK